VKRTSREVLKELLPTCEEQLHSIAVVRRVDISAIIECSCGELSVVTPSVAKLLNTTVPALVGRLADLGRA
jgi:hypothetical protein